MATDVDKMIRDAGAVPPVDRSKRVLTDGRPETADHRDINPATGMQKGYIVLSAEERARGFVRPLAETYARDPHFYSGTFCVGCRVHFPVGPDGEFVWDDGEKVGI